LSATRAAHRVRRRTRELYERGRALKDRARVRNKLNTEEAYEADPDFLAGSKLHDQAYRVGLFARIVQGDRPGTRKVEMDFWCATTLKGRLYFHPPDVPVRVWAVSMGPTGISWTEAEIIKVTDRNIMVRYAGETARLDRGTLWHWWAFWRNVRFVSSRTGRIAAELDTAWWERHGARGSVPPSMQMPLADAMALLGVPANYTRDDVIATFRRAAKKAHPDLGGTAEMFRKLVEARDRLLAALGTSAPPPKPPQYAPKGATIVYRTGGSSRSSRRLGTGGLRLR
jgi:hypothetical protein